MSRALNRKTNEGGKWKKIVLTDNKCCRLRNENFKI